MSEFKSWRSYWDFERATQFRYRYIHDSDVQEFLNSVLETSKKRRKTIPQDSGLWRAQIGCVAAKNDDDQPAPFPRERMKPIPHKAVEGRANPKGISYLYLATDKNTAMSEVRPWKGSLISVGQFRVKKNLTIVDFSGERKDFDIYLKEPSPEKRESSVWSHINKAFLTPINPTDDIAAYAPTQIIAEIFKNNGDDGIIYNSSLGEGSNVMLFDLDVADIINCFLYAVDKISFQFEEAASPYLVRD